MAQAEKRPPQPEQQPPPVEAEAPHRGHQRFSLLSALTLAQAESVSDLSDLSWVNSLLEWLWPKANSALTQLVKNDLREQLRKHAPPVLNDLRFPRFSLGKNTPEFGPIEVSQYSETRVEVSVGMNYFSDVDILVKVGLFGPTFGVRHLAFQGQLCIVLALMPKLPVFGAVEVFCPNMPKLSLQFTGMAAMAHSLGIEGKILQAVDGLLRSRLVLPSRRLMVLADSDEAVDAEAMSHPPLGVLKIRILGCRNLPALNRRRVQGSDVYDSDPFCRLELAGATARTSTVQGSTSPSWPATEAAAYFVVYHRDQRVNIEVINGQQAGLFAARDSEPLGSASVAIAEIMRKWPRQSGPGTRRATLSLDAAHVSRDLLQESDPLNQGVVSELDAEVEWFELGETKPSAGEQQALAAADAAPVGVLLVDVRKGVGFPLEAIGEKAGLRWRSRAEPSQLAAAQSQAGSRCDLEAVEFPEVSLDPKLFPVVDKLVARETSHEDTAKIVGVDSAEVIAQYLDAKQAHAEQQARMSEREKSRNHKVSLEWRETLVHFVHAPEDAALTLELLDGDDDELGRIGPFPLRAMSEANPSELPRAWRALELSQLSGLAAWGRAAKLQRFSAVQLDVSAKLRFLRAGRGLAHRGKRLK